MQGRPIGFKYMILLVPVYDSKSLSAWNLPVQLCVFEVYGTHRDPPPPARDHLDSILRRSPRRDLSLARNSCGCGSAVVPEFRFDRLCRRESLLRTFRLHSRVYLCRPGYLATCVLAGTLCACLSRLHLFSDRHIALLHLCALLHAHAVRRKHGDVCLAQAPSSRGFPAGSRFVAVMDSRRRSCMELCSLELIR